MNHDLSQCDELIYIHATDHNGETNMTTVTREHLAGLQYALMVAEENWPNAALTEILSDLIAQASAAPEQEALLIQAVAVTLEDDDEGLRLEWLLEGGISELEFAGTVLFAMPESNDLCVEDGSAYLYRRPDGDIEQLRADKQYLQRTVDRMNEARAEVVRELAEAQALLRDIYLTCNLPKTPSEHAISDISNSIKSLLSATAQPAECATCKGTGLVDDGEITCSEGGIPFENGPIECVKDCSACRGSER